MQERQSNLELLRIVLMITIPVYHLLLYNGVFYMELNDYVLVGLLLSSGGAITADYAFIALSSYFLIETKEKPVISRFLFFVGQVLVMYLIRLVVIRSLWGFHTGNWFVEDYIMKGAWWFVIPYCVMILIYPYLNIWMKNMTKQQHLCGIIVCCGLLLCNKFLNLSNVVTDFVVFLLVYITIGYLRRDDYKSFIIKNTRRNMLLVYVIGFLLTFLSCVMIKYSGLMLQENANEVVKAIINKYSLLQYVMGIAIFLFFREMPVFYSKWINQVAKSTFFVFLLHETVLGVYWYFGKINGTYSTYEPLKFYGWMILYVISCFIVGIVVERIYTVFCKPIWKKIVVWICSRTIIIAIEDMYYNERNNQSEAE